MIIDWEDKIVSTLVHVFYVEKHIKSQRKRGYLQIWKTAIILNRQQDGHESKTSTILSLDKMSNFLINVPDDCYVLIKVTLIFGFYDTCRSEELGQLNARNIEDTSSIFVVTLPDSKTKKK